MEKCKELSVTYLDPDIQYLSSGPNRAIDVVKVRCESCGAGHTFTFDIEEFYKASHDTMAVARFILDPQEHALDEELEARVLKYTAPPMQSTPGFLKKLAESKDDLALQYLEEAIQHFKQQASG